MTRKLYNLEERKKLKFWTGDFSQQSEGGRSGGVLTNVML